MSCPKKTSEVKGNGVAQCGHFATRRRGSFRCELPPFQCKSWIFLNFGFFEIYGVSVRVRGKWVQPVHTKVSGG